MAEYNNVQIRLRIDSKENWTTNNTVLANGEVGIVVDGSSIDIKAGNNGASFTSLPYLVGDNAAMINMGSRIDTTNNRINNLQGNIDALDRNVATDRGNFNLELVNNYTTSRKMLDEYIPGTDIEKRREIGNWAEWIASDVYPEHRLTDGVSWDSIFIVLKSLKEAGILPINDEDAFNFGEILKQYLADLNNMHETEGRGALDYYRDGIL